MNNEINKSVPVASATTTTATTTTATTTTATTTTATSSLSEKAAGKRKMVSSTDELRSSSSNSEVSSALKATKSWSPALSTESTQTATSSQSSMSGFEMTTTSQSPTLFQRLMDSSSTTLLSNSFFSFPAFQELEVASFDQSRATTSAAASSSLYEITTTTTSATTPVITTTTTTTSTVVTNANNSNNVNNNSNNNVNAPTIWLPSFFLMLLVEELFRRHDIGGIINLSSTCKNYNQGILLNSNFRFLPYCVNSIPVGPRNRDVNPTQALIAERRLNLVTLRNAAMSVMSTFDTPANQLAATNHIMQGLSDVGSCNLVKRIKLEMIIRFILELDNAHRYLMLSCPESNLIMRTIEQLPRFELMTVKRFKMRAYCELLTNNINNPIEYFKIFPALNELVDGDINTKIRTELVSHLTRILGLTRTQPSGQDLPNLLLKLVEKLKNSSVSDYNFVLGRFFTEYLCSQVNAEPAVINRLLVSFQQVRGGEIDDYLRLIQRFQADAPKINSILNTYFTRFSQLTIRHHKLEERSSIINVSRLFLNNDITLSPENSSILVKQLNLFIFNDNELMTHLPTVELNELVAVLKRYSPNETHAALDARLAQLLTGRS